MEQFRAFNAAWTLQRVSCCREKGGFVRTLSNQARSAPGCPIDGCKSTGMLIHKKRLPVQAGSQQLLLGGAGPGSQGGERG